MMTACTVQFAPAYDQIIADGLATANKDMQTLFATMGTAVTKDTFKTRADSYAKIIGELNALEIQVKTRPAPSAAITLTEANAALRKIGITPMDADPNFSNMPSARAIHDTANTLTHMRDLDATAGVRGDALKAFANQANIFISQAIAYESFLKR